MIKTMRTNLTTGAAFLIISAGSALGEDTPSIMVEPVGIRFNYRDFDNYIKKGLEVGICFTGADSNSLSIGTMRADSLLLKDSNIKNLGSPARIENNYKTEIGLRHFYFKSDKLPSPGAKWLHLTGKIPVMYFSHNKKTTEPVLIKIEQGEKAQAGDFQIEVKEINKTQSDNAENPEHWYSVDLESSEELIEDSSSRQFWDFKLTDKDGNDLQFEKSSRSGLGGGGKTKTTTYTYIFTELPESIKIAIVYSPIKKGVIPIDLKFDLYPEDDCN